MKNMYRFISIGLLGITFGFSWELGSLLSRSIIPAFSKPVIITVKQDDGRFTILKFIKGTVEVSHQSSNTLGANHD